MNEFIELKAALAAFATERDWDQFHTPKNLVMALAGEVGELVAEFQWLDGEESTELPPETRERVRLELADVFIYFIRLCDKLHVDPVEAAHDKMQINADRYAPNQAKGTATKYTRLEGNRQWP